MLPVSRAALATTLSVATILTACSSVPRSALELPTVINRLDYLGEIKGTYNGRSLLNPEALVFDQAGNLYVVDTGNNRVIKLSREFEFVRETGGFGSELGGLNRPLDIASDGGITFFVLDQGNRRLVKLDYNLIFTDEIRFDSNPDFVSVGQAAGIACSDYGRLFLLDPDNLRALMLDTDYALERTLRAPGGFANCTAIAVTADGNSYVYDEGKKAVFRFDTFGNPGGKISLSLVGRLGGFVVTRHSIIATDTQRNEIAIFDRNGQRLLAQGGPGAGPYSLQAPSGIAVRSDGRLFVCDSGNNRITYYEIIPD